MANEQYQLTVDNASAITLTMADRQPLNGVVDLEHGGTNATTAAGARTSLELGTIAQLNIITLTSNVTGILPIANGGTGPTKILPLANGGTGANNGLPIANVTGILYGQTTLIGGSKALTSLTNVTTSSKAFVQNASTTTGLLKAVCTAGTLTITCSESSTATVNYFIIL